MRRLARSAIAPPIVERPSTYACVMSRSTLPIPVESAMDQLHFEHRPRRSGDLAHLRRARMPLAHVILVGLEIGGAIVILVVKFKLDVLRLDVDVEHRRRRERGEGAERIPDIAAGLLAD